MNGSFDANLTTIPPLNLIILFTGLAVLLILISIILVFIVKKLGVKNIGGIQLEHRGMSTEYHMNNETKDSDDSCKKQMRQITDSIKIHISNIFAGTAICPIARVAISSVILKPLYASLGNNHFTTELMPERFDAYRSRIIELVKDEYISLSSFSTEVNCTRDTLPLWDVVNKRFYESVDIWLKRISREVIQSCEKKITIYQKYLEQFAAAKDDYRTGIVRSLIEKNEKYIVVLRTRI